MTESTKTLRCAVYTRKSTEEGLELDFNSLQAQREACEAFIKSQRGEGWQLISTPYDDGGISGGTMERPALQRLMADITAKRLDVVVVYKVDRLTRSLSDFSKIVEVFDKSGVSFVAVTQQFNTTTSMGRLTLNVLLSFAQFEREVTAERIRDKIAATKKKGMWVGGSTPRGYRVEDKKLLVDPEKAEEVRTIFKTYLECANIRELALLLRKRGIEAVPKTKHGELTLSRGALATLLRNSTYIGLTKHKDKTYPGQHEAIIEQELWGAVQAKLDTMRKCRGRPKRLTEQRPLMGKLFDERGRKLTPQQTRKKEGRRYAYYVTHEDDRDEDALQQRSGGWRLPAKEIEARVADIVGSMLKNGAVVVQLGIQAGLKGTDLELLLQRVEQADWIDHLLWVQRVNLHPYQVEVSVKLPTEVAVEMRQTVPIALRRRGVERRMVISPEAQQPGQPDAQILRVISLALRFWTQMNGDSSLTALDFAKQEKVDNRFLGRALPLAFLAPEIVEYLVAGYQSPSFTSERLIRWDPLPLLWKAQAEVVC